MFNSIRSIFSSQRFNDETAIERNEEEDHDRNNQEEDDGNDLEQNPSLNEENESASRYFIYNVQEATVVHSEEEDVVLPVENLNDHVRDDTFNRNYLDDVHVRKIGANETYDSLNLNHSVAGRSFDNNDFFEIDLCVGVRRRAVWYPLFDCQRDVRFVKRIRLDNSVSDECYTSRMNPQRRRTFQSLLHHGDQVDHTQGYEDDSEDDNEDEYYRLLRNGYRFVNIAHDNDVVVISTTVDQPLRSKPWLVHVIDKVQEHTVLWSFGFVVVVGVAVGIFFIADEYSGENDAVPNVIDVTTSHYIGSTIWIAQNLTRASNMGALDLKELSNFEIAVQNWLDPSAVGISISPEIDNANTTAQCKIFSQSEYGRRIRRLQENFIGDFILGLKYELSYSLADTHKILTDDVPSLVKVYANDNLNELYAWLDVFNIAGILEVSSVQITEPMLPSISPSGKCIRLLFAQLFG